MKYSEARLTVSHPDRPEQFTTNRYSVRSLGPWQGFGIVDKLTSVVVAHPFTNRVAAKESMNGQDVESALRLRARFSDCRRKTETARVDER
jgi:hypothetical protein